MSKAWSEMSHPERVAFNAGVEQGKLCGEAEQKEPTLADLERQLKQAEFEKQAYTDALRYRWLREHDMTFEYCAWIEAKLNKQEVIDLEGAIDAAMSASSTRHHE